MKKLVLGFALLWMAAFGVSEDVVLNDNVPDEYTVVKGDTLWDISAMFLRDPWLWPEIWHVNQQIANPHLIYPGDIIQLVYIDGKPRLMLKRDRNKKLSPEIRVIDHADAIEALPRDIIDNFLSRTRVSSDEELNAAPYVLGGMERRLMSGKGDDFYARGDFSTKYRTYGIYRRGDPWVDPVSGEVLGVRAAGVGEAKVKGTEDDIATLGAIYAETEIRAKDRLLPLEQRNLETVYYPKAPDGEIDAVIMTVEGAVHSGGALDVVSLNKGLRDGLKQGDTLAIFKKGETITDRVTNKPVTLPPERVGLVMVFYPTEKMSFALIMEGDRQISVGDLLRNP